MMLETDGLRSRTIQIHSNRLHSLEKVQAYAQFYGRLHLRGAQNVGLKD